MDLRIDEDVVNVEIASRDRLRGVDGRAGGKDGGEGDILLDISDGDGGVGTLTSTGRGLHGNLDTVENVAGGDEEDVGLGLNVDGNEALTVGDGNGGNRETRVTVEPEDHN